MGLLICGFLFDLQMFVADRLILLMLTSFWLNCLVFTVCCGLMCLGFLLSPTLILLITLLSVTILVYCDLILNVVYD